MGAGNIRAGGAFVEMFVKDGTVAKTLASVRKQLTTFGQSVQSLGLSSLGLGTAIGAPMAASVASFASSGAAIDDMANRTGIGSDALQELSYAAGQSATDMDSLEKGLLKMQRVMVEAGEGSQTARDALQKLGLSTADLAGLTGDMQFERIAGQIASISDPAQRTAAAIGIFGKSGAELLPLLNEGSAGIARMREEAQRLGLVMDKDAIANAAILDDGIARLSMTLGAFKNAIGAAIVGPAIQFTDWMTTTVGAVNRWVMANRGLVVGVGMVGISLAATGAALIGVGTAIQVLGFAVGGLATAWAAFGTVLTTIAGSPLLLVLAGMAAITAAVPALREGVMGALGDLTVGFGDLLGTATTTLDGIVDAMSSGNMALAAKVLWAGVNAAWLQGTQGLRQVWREAVIGLSMVMTDAFAGVQSAWVVMTRFMGDSWDMLTGGMGGAWSDLQNSIASGLVTMFGKITGQTPAQIAEMQESLKEEQNAQKQASQQRMTMREREAQAQIEAIRKAQAETKDELGAELNRQNEAAKSELDAAIAELQAARSEAATAKTDSEKKRIASVAGATPLGGDFTSTLGTFSASAAQQSRVSGLSGLQSAADRTADATEELANRAKTGGIVFA